jgi:excisionase family DNA binding protein
VKGGPPDEALLLSIEHVARSLSVSVRTVENLIARRELSSLRVGRLRRVPRAAITDYIARLEREQADGDVEPLAPEALRLVRRVSGRG